MANDRRENRLVAIQALSSIVIAGSMIALVRYRKGVEMSSRQEQEPQIRHFENAAS